MTDFAQEPLWEDDQKEPEVLKSPKVDEPTPLAAVGNAAIARMAPRNDPPADKETAPAPMMPDKAEPAAPAIIAKTDHLENAEPPEVVADPEVEPEMSTEREVPDDWETPFVAVLTAISQGGLDRALTPFLEVAPQVPDNRQHAVAHAIVSAFLELPAESRKPVRDALVEELKRWPGLPVVRLILTRLAGVPPAQANPPPPPPPPPVDT